MKRIHLFEWEDLSWLPSSFRSFITDLLQHRLTFFNVYHPVIPKVEHLMQEMDEKNVLDLCSGGGGFLLHMDKHWQSNNADISITMTDKYPNIDAFKHIHTLSDKRINYREDPIDVTAVPKSMNKVRTLFSAFHHFEPEAAQEILQNAVHSKSAIGIFEFTERTPANIVKTAIFSPLVTLLQTPRVTPFKWSRFFWTYIIPVVPFITTWDAIVSNLRSYTEEELHKMTSAVEGSENYCWHIEKVIVGDKAQIPVMSLIGYPKES